MSEVFDNRVMAGARFTNVSREEAVFDDVNLSGVMIEDSAIEGLRIGGHDIGALIAAEEERQRRKAG